MKKLMYFSFGLVVLALFPVWIFFVIMYVFTREMICLGEMAIDKAVGGPK